MTTATTEAAGGYDIVAVRRWGDGNTWGTLASAKRRAKALDRARYLLDGGYAKAVSVQGRGTQAHPTPASEVQIYRGVAAGFRPAAFWPDLPDLSDVEVRTHDDARNAHLAPR